MGEQVATSNALPAAVVAAAVYAQPPAAAAAGKFSFKNFKLFALLCLYIPT